MKVLVTGANGFVGSHLVEYLHAQGCDVRCLLQIGDSPTFFQHTERIEWITGDLRDRESLQKAAQQCDWVYHLAALSRYDAHQSEADYRTVNVEGTQSLLQACELHHVKKFIYVSSIEAVGLSPNGRPLTEQSIPHPRNTYGRSKLEAERAVLSFPSRHPMDRIVTRIATTYGPREKMLFQRIFKPISRGFYVLFGDGSSLIEFSYVKNQVKGLWLAAEKGRSGEIYFLSDERSYTFKEVIQEIGTQMRVRLRLIPLPRPIAWTAALLCEGMSKVLPYPFYVKETNRPPFSRATLQWTMKSTIFCDTTKARNELGHTPAYSLKEGLKETLVWYRTARWL